MYNRKADGGTTSSEGALQAGKQAVKKKHPAKKNSVHIEPDNKRKKTEPEEEEDVAV